MIFMAPTLKSCILLLIASLASVVGGANVAQAETSSAGFDKYLLPYLTTHCYRCHNADKPKGEFRLDKLSKNVGTENNPQWLEVMERINSGEMPPRSEPQRPSTQESAQVVEWLAARMKEGEAARMASRQPSGVSAPEARMPSPPALETATASALPCTPAIGA